MVKHAQDLVAVVEKLLYRMVEGRHDGRTSPETRVPGCRAQPGGIPKFWMQRVVIIAPLLLQGGRGVRCHVGS